MKFAAHLERWIDLRLAREIGFVVILAAALHQLLWGWPSSLLGYASVVLGWGIGIGIYYGAQALWRRR